MNLWEEWEHVKCFAGATSHNQAVLSNVARQLTLSSAGWWRITVSGDAWVRGPDATYSAVTSTTGMVLWRQESWFVKVPHGSDPMHMGVLGKGVTGQKAYADRVKGP